MNKEPYHNLIVLVRYKVHPSKCKEAIAALEKLITEVKNEPHFVKITLHLDPKDESNILLYEEWTDEAYYNGDHLKTNQLKSFKEDSRDFMAGPPEITQWRIEQEF